MNFKTAAALLLLALACRAHAQQQPPQQPPAAPDVRRLFLPGKALALDIDLRGFGEYTAEVLDDFPSTSGDDPVLRMADPSQGSASARTARVFYIIPKPPKEGQPRFTSFTVRVEPAQFDTAPQALREAAVAGLLKSGRVSKSSMKEGEYKQSPLLRYGIQGPPPGAWMYPVFTGLSAFPAPSGVFGFPGPSGTLMRALDAYQVHPGAWVWIRCVAREIKEEDEKLLHSLIDSARLVDTSRPSSSFDHYQLGREHYRLKEHGRAVAALSRALDLERQKRELDQASWRQLIMTLANAHGAADDVQRAREVLEYGVSAEPTYAFFHHGLARLHGFFGDIDMAVASLHKAYEFAPKVKNWMGGAIPDPMFDPAFAKLKDAPKFRDAVKEMKKQYKKKPDARPPS